MRPIGVLLECETPLRWYWSQPTNFNYSTLEVEWTEAGADNSATVNLNELTYQSGSESGAFSRDVVAQWLKGAGEEWVGARQVDAVFGYFEAASRGELPPPWHHSHHVEFPVRVSVQHYLLGYGVGSPDYVWFGIWLLGVGWMGWKYFAGDRRRADGLTPRANVAMSRA